MKRIPDLLAAMTYLPAHYRLQIWGEGIEKARIVREIERLGISGRVSMHTGVGRDAIQSFDVLVLPSEAEGFGLVLIEAMAAGVPVVATNVVGIRDVVRDEDNGLLVPVAAPRSLARAIQRVSNDVPLRERLIERGLREVREKYDWNCVIEQYRKLLITPAS